MNKTDFLLGMNLAEHPKLDTNRDKRKSRFCIKKFEEEENNLYNNLEYLTPVSWDYIQTRMRQEV